MEGFKIPLLKILMNIIPAIKIPAGAIKIPAEDIKIPAEGMEGVQNTNIQNTN